MVYRKRKVIRTDKNFQVGNALKKETKQTNKSKASK